MSRLLKNAHLLKFPSSFTVQRTRKYASRLRISGALHLGIFEQPAKKTFSTCCEGGGASGAKEESGV